VRLLKEGNLNTQITKMIGQISAIYKANPLEGVLSHQVKKHMIDGDNVIINKEATDQKVEEHKFEKFEVYVLDIILTTGEGKPKETEIRTTVFKRALEMTYNLKLKHSRMFFHTISEKYPTMPFSIASLKDATTARVGVAECVNHDMLHMYPVLTEKPGELVAQFKATIVLLPAGTQILCEPLFDTAMFDTAFKIEDKGILDLLATTLGKQKKKATKEDKKEPPATAAAPVPAPVQVPAPAKEEVKK
jgi:curved DNA binding protein